MIHGCQLAKLTVAAVDAIGDEGCDSAEIELRIATLIMEDLMVNVKLVMSSMTAAGLIAVDPSNRKFVPGPQFAEVKRTIDKVRKDQEGAEATLAIEQLLNEVSSIGRDEDHLA